MIDELKLMQNIYMKCETAALRGAVAACKGLPLHAVADSGYRSRSAEGDAWERGWGYAAGECGTGLESIGHGQSAGLTIR